MNAIYLYRIEHFFYKNKIIFIAKLIRAIIYLLHNCYIPYSATIGKNTKFGYKGIGVVIHSNAVIGDNCIICQNVTIGGKSGDNGVPRVGNNVFIGAGAVVLGDVSVGNNVVIGANAVVINNIPDNCTCAGVPAHIISTTIKGISRE